MVLEDVLKRSNVLRMEGGNEARSGTNIDGINVRLMERVHMAFGEETVGEEREKHKLGESEELIAGESETGSSVECQLVLLLTNRSRDGAPRSRSACWHLPGARKCGLRSSTSARSSQVWTMRQRASRIVSLFVCETDARVSQTAGITSRR